MFLNDLKEYGYEEGIDKDFYFDSAQNLCFNTMFDVRKAVDIQKNKIKL